MTKAGVYVAGLVNIPALDLRCLSDAVGGVMTLVLRPELEGVHLGKEAANALRTVQMKKDKLALSQAPEHPALSILQLTARFRVVLTLPHCTCVHRLLSAVAFPRARSAPRFARPSAMACANPRLMRMAGSADQGVFDSPSCNAPEAVHS